MQKIDHYNKLIRNVEIIIMKIIKLEKNNFKKNKNEIALLSSTLAIALVNLDFLLDEIQEIENNLI
jgi:hypothetical protein